MASRKSVNNFNVVTISLSLMVMSMMLIIVGISKKSTPQPSANAAQVASDLQCPENTRATLSCYNKLGKEVRASKETKNIYCTWECEPGDDYDEPLPTPYIQGGGKLCPAVLCADNCQITKLPNDCQTCYCPGSSYGGFEQY